MSQEILYTSAPQGLKPGSRGFCTVVQTTGTPRMLVERLESFSGYRHAFMAHEAGAGQSPVNYAHCHLVLGGRRYHVLSRIADAGLDYTHRSNKLAHHVAAEPGEAAAAPGGPAWVMASPGFFIERWDGQLNPSASNRPLPAQDRPPQVCQRWKQLTGDAGWAGVLAEAALRPRGLMSVIFPLGTPNLELVVEALSLLPPPQRWEVTFSTYFTKALAGVDCQWRFLLDGTPEAAALRRDVRAASIDLTNPPGRAAGGELVDAARRGVPVASRPRRAAPAAPETRAPTRPQAVPAPAAPPVAQSPQSQWDTLLPPTPVVPRRTSLPPVWQPSSPDQRKRGLWLALAGCGLLMLLMGLFLAAVLLRQGPPVPPVAVGSDTEEFGHAANAPPGDSQPEPTVVPQEGSAEDPAAEEGQEPEAIAQSDSPGESDPAGAIAGDADAREAATSDPAEESPRPELPPKPPNPFDGIEGPLQLPQRIVRTGEGGLATSELNSEIVRLVSLDLDDPSALRLELVGEEFDSGENEIKYHEEQEERQWQVWETQRGTGGVRKEKVHIATFSFRDGDLRFQWKDKSPFLYLAFCRLWLTAGVEDHEFRRQFAFYVETREEPTRSLADLDSKIEIFIDEQNQIWEDDSLRVDLLFKGVKGTRFVGDKKWISRDKNQRTIETHRLCSSECSVECKAYIRLILTQTSLADGGGRLEIEVMPESHVYQLRIKQQPGYQEAFNLDKQRLLQEQITDPVFKLSREGIKNQKLEQNKQIANFRRAFQATGPHNQSIDWSSWQEQPQDNRKQTLRYAGFRKEIERIRKVQAPDKQRELKIGLQQKSAEKVHEQFPYVKELFEKYFLVDSEPLATARARDVIAKHRDYLEEWSRKMTDFLDELSEQGQLDYRLYVERDGQQIDLVRTAGFSPGPKNEGP